MQWDEQGQFNMTENPSHIIISFQYELGDNFCVVNYFKMVAIG